MPNLSKYVSYLSQEIGPRPAGTEEEQKAAFFIEERMKKGSGLPTEIEEFEGANGNDMTRLICAGVTLVAALLYMITPALAIPAVVLSIIATALFVADYLGKPVISRFFKKGISQNVVTKYQPDTTQTRGRKRKIIIVTRYDSGKVRPELNEPFAKFLGLANKISAACIPFLLVWMLFRSLLFMYPEGAGAVILNIITILAMLACALPLILKAVHQNAAYNDGANGSASGVAVLVEVAKRVARGEYDETFDYEPTVHGQQAAEEEGVVPEGAELIYDAEQNAFEDLDDQNQADLAYGMDMPTEEFAPISLNDEPVVEPELEDEAVQEPVVEEAPIESVEEEAIEEPFEEPQVEEPVVVKEEAPAVPEPAPVAPVAAVAATTAVAATAAVAAAPKIASAASQPALSDDHVPSWFKTAQAKAKKSVANVPASSYRSRYASSWEAIDELTPEPVVDESVQVAVEPVVEAPVAESVYEQPVAEAPVVEPVCEQPVQAEQPVAEQPVVVEEPVVAEQPVELQEEVVEQEAAAQSASQAKAEGERLVAVYKAAAEAPRVLVNPERSSQVVTEESIDEPLVDVSEVLAEGVEAIPEEVAEPEMPSFLRDEEELTNDEPESEAPQSVPDFIGLPEIEPVPSGRRPVVLPDITASSFAPIEDLQQRAPLADGEQAGSTAVAAKGLLTMLPAIDLAGANEPAKRPSLTLPSLSGSLNPVSAPAAGSAGMTGSFAPVGEDLAEQVEDIEDLYIDDADDSEFDENFTESGAYAGPDYVEMPKSRFGGFFGKMFGGKKNKAAGRPSVNSSSYQYEDDFEDSYVDEEPVEWSEAEPVHEKDRTVQFDAIDDDNWNDWDEEDRRWEGGAFSSFKEKVSGAAGAAQGAVGNAAGALGSVKDRLPFGGSKEEEPAAERHTRRHNHDEQGEAPVQHVHTPYVDPYAGLGLNLSHDFDEPVQDAPQVDEQQMAEDFQNPPIKTEVWFVALGADMDGNAGMRAFMEEHASELRGAMVIELEAVGAGDLCLVGEEGSLKPVKASSRMKRFIRKANKALGISVPTVKLDWNDSASSYAATHGCQALHLVGMEGNAPALLGKPDDIAENVDEQALAITADYIMEVLHAV